MNLSNLSKFCVGLCVIIAEALLVTSCRTVQTAVDSKDLSYLYNPTKNLFSPRYSVFNETDERSMLSVRFFNSDLYFSEANPQGIPTAQILISVKVYDTGRGRILADTAASYLSIIKDTTRQEYVYSIPMKVEAGGDYMTEVKVLDRIRMQVVQAFVPFSTLTRTSRYNFRVRSHFENNLLFNPVVATGDYVNLLYPRFPLDTIYISLYAPVEGIPDPPSMLLPERIIDYPPDTTVALAYSDTLPMMFPGRGVYHITTERVNTEGFTFFNFGESFPVADTPEAMMDPLEYLVSKDELARMKSAPRPKVALDEFWISCGGNVERARELIRIFYTRVQYSNYYFTSFKEGWRTERGMVYIIYGPPDKVYKTSDGEQWGYRKPAIRSTWGGRVHMSEDYIYFTFRTRKSDFTDNDFYISRSETLVTYWDQAVASWLKGIVFRFDNPDDI